MEEPLFISGLGKFITTSYTNFYNALLELESAKADIVTPRDEACVIIDKLKRNNLESRCGTWTSAGIEYAREQLPLLVYSSRLLNPELAKKAVEVNSRGNRHHFSTDSTREYEESLAIAEEDKSREPSERRVMVLPSRDPLVINPVFNWDVLRFLLNDQAKNYYDSTTLWSIELYPIPSELVDFENGTTLTQLWFGVNKNRSYFDGESSGLGLSFESGVRGKCHKSFEEGTKELLYSKEDVSNALKSLNLPGLEEQLIAELEKGSK